MIVISREAATYWVTRSSRVTTSLSLPRHLRAADAVAFELLVVVHGDVHPQQSPGEFERRLVMRHRAAAVAPDVEAGPRDQRMESKRGLQRTGRLAIDQ